MSSDVVVYVVKEAEIRNAMGSANKRLINRINRNYADVFEEFREDDFDAPEDYSYEDAVNDLICGNTKPNLPWHLNGFAIEAILNTLAEMLGNFPTSGSSFDERFNSIFADLDAPLDLTRLTSLAEISDLFPAPDEEPYWGCWTLETCRNGAASLKKADLSDYPEFEQEVIADLTEWMRTAVRRKAILIGMWV